MTRIATFGQSQLLLQDVLRNEHRVYEGQRRITSGIQERDYKGFAIDVTTLAGAKNLKASALSYQHDNDQVMRRLDLYDINLDSMRNIAQGLRDDVLAAINGNTGVALRQKIDDYAQSLVSLLDTRDNSRYIFGGSLTDQSPVAPGRTTAALAGVTDADGGLADDFSITIGSVSVTDLDVSAAADGAT